MAVFQVIFNKKLDFRKAIKSLLVESLIKIDGEEIDDLFTYKYDKIIGKDKYLVGFDLNLQEIYEERTLNFIYNNAIHSDLDIEHIFIYKDPEIKLQGVINGIEQSLREVLFYIFAQQYPNDIFNLFKEIDIKLTGDHPRKEVEFKKLNENQFFYLLFTDYIKLSDLKPFSEKDLIKYIENNDKYSSLRDKIINRGITNENHKYFILSLKDIMDPIHKIRNCIAHNRNFSEDVYDNFLEAEDIFQEKIKDFWEKENLES